MSHHMSANMQAFSILFSKCTRRKQAERFYFEKGITMNAFEQYLQQYNLEALTVSIAAQVRYLTVWNALKGKPITAEQAAKIREGIFKLTGIRYRGEFVLAENQTHDNKTNNLKHFPHLIRT
jgi:hypothetical protein